VPGTNTPDTESRLPKQELVSFVAQRAKTKKKKKKEENLLCSTSNATQNKEEQRKKEEEYSQKSTCQMQESFKQTIVKQAKLSRNEEQTLFCVTTTKADGSTSLKWGLGSKKNEVTGFDAAIDVALESGVPLNTATPDHLQVVLEIKLKRKSKTKLLATQSKYH
jgi:hypothetical protein